MWKGVGGGGRVVGLAALVTAPDVAGHGSRVRVAFWNGRAGGGVTATNATGNSGACPVAIVRRGRGGGTTPTRCRPCRLGHRLPPLPPPPQLACFLFLFTVQGGARGWLEGAGLRGRAERRPTGRVLRGLRGPLRAPGRHRGSEYPGVNRLGPGGRPQATSVVPWVARVPSRRPEGQGQPARRSSLTT